MPPHLQVLITLRYMATGSFQLIISDCHDVSQPTVSRCVSRVSRAIASMRPEVIKMPTHDESLNVMQDFKNIGHMPGIIGCIDCTHVLIQKPRGNNTELFRNRKGKFSFNVQAVCGPQLQFFNVVARWPGSTHDSRIFWNSTLCMEMENGMHRGRLLGDAGYSCTPYMFTPLRDPQTPQEVRYNRCHITTRNSVERAFGLLKRRFSCLTETMRASLENTKVIIVAAAVLHNLALENRVPIPDEEDEDEDELMSQDAEDAPEDDRLNVRGSGNVQRQQYIRDNF